MVLFFNPERLGTQSENFALGFEQLGSPFVRLTQLHGLNPFVEAMSLGSQSLRHFGDGAAPLQ